VAILSVSEFEAVLGQACIKVDKALYERANPPPLEEARRTLESVQNAARDAKKLKSLRAKLDSAVEVVSGEIPNDEKLREDLWDLLDYIDYRI
jgi:hypothetical protein